MVDETTPTPEPTEPFVAPTEQPVAATEPVVAPTEQPVAATEPPKKRRIWPFILAGGILVFLAIVVGAIVLIVNIVTGLTATPTKAVLDLDKAFATADCDLLISTTTQDFRDAYFSEGTFDCAAWEENANALTVDGVYAYEVTVNGSEIDGATAEVTTTEIDSTGEEPITFELKYTLVNDGGWLVDYIENVTQ